MFDHDELHPYPVIVDEDGTITTFELPLDLWPLLTQAERERLLAQYPQVRKAYGKRKPPPNEQSRSYESFMPGRAPRMLMSRRVKCDLFLLSTPC